MVADTRGRRLFFLLSLVVMFLGTLGYVGVAATGGSLVLFLVMSVVLGLGFTFYSGAVEAWLVDALKATNFDADLDRVFARSSMITGVAMLAGTIAGRLLGSVHLSLPFIVRSALLVIVFIIALVTMRDVGFTPLELYGNPKAVAVAGFIAAAIALAGIAGNMVVEFLHGTAASERR